ncbi:hypothetical protein [uncultured Sphingomonas sp.]|uniref:hypothetical protein n=1 Tax=uncultured Sphingomonas sp. TaxID=158754 RepID=UPI0025EF4622|nr:hypothetical protein [uncultured Sphingomonas sp.]
MAYLDHASAFAAGSAQPVAADWALAPSEASGFSALEWSVIALARRDRLSSLTAPGAISRAFGSLFGLGRQSMLADPQLEALRRVAVHAWHKGYTLPVSEIKRFLASGFNSAQLDTLLASISGQRAARARH